MQITVESQASYQLPAQTFILLMVEPALQSNFHRTLDENLTTTPTEYSEFQQDSFGNLQRRLLAPQGPFGFHYRATLEVQPNKPLPHDAPEPAPADIPAEAMVFTLPSRYCESDELTRMARDEFGDLEKGGSRVLAIAAWIRQHVEYQYGTTDSMTSAYDIATQRIGVCRDFAHLLISFCRALGIPARYVSGYCLDLEPPDFHGWAQVYLGGAWHNIDATFDGTRPALAPIAVGRDAADVAMMTLFGQADLNEQSVRVQQKIDEEDEPKHADSQTNNTST